MHHWPSASGEVFCPQVKRASFVVKERYKFRPSAFLFLFFPNITYSLKGTVPHASQQIQLKVRHGWQHGLEGRQRRR